jgi:hypothetical protein
MIDIDPRVMFCELCRHEHVITMHFHGIPLVECPYAPPGEFLVLNLDYVRPRPFRGISGSVSVVAP